MPLAAASPEPVELDQVLNTFDPRRGRAPDEPVGFGDALAGPRAGAQRGDRQPAGVLGLLRPVAEEPLLAPDRARAVHHRARGDRRRARAGGRDPGRGVRLASTPPSPRSPRSRGRSSRSRSPRARRPRPSGSTPCRGSALARHRDPLFDDLEPAARRCRTARRDRLGARDRDAGPAPAPTAQRAARADLRVALRLQQRHRRAGPGISARTRRTTILGPALKFVDAGADRLQLRRSAPPEPLRRRQRRRRHRHLAAVHRLRRPKGPNSEGMPSSGPANGGGDGKNFLHSNPYPNTASPGQTRECEAGNEPYKRRPGRVRQPARQPGDEHRAGQRALRTRQEAAVRREARAQPRPDARICGRRYRGPSPWIVGLIVALLLASGSISPSRRRSRSPATATSCTRRSRTRPRSPNSPVRIAGVNVGKVTRSSPTATPPRSPSRSTTRAADPPGRDDEIRPRLFLEGNFFLDLTRAARARPSSATATRSRSARRLPQCSSTRS